MYIPLAQAAQNDVKGLLNIDPAITKEVCPLLDICGKLDKHIKDFCNNWPDNSNFFVDVSPIAIQLSEVTNINQDKHNDLISNLGLENPNDGFLSRRRFYLDLKSKHSSLIPCISWENTSATRRDVLRFSRELEKDFNTIAIRVCLWNDASDHQQNLDFTKAILDAVEEHNKIWLLIDFGQLGQINELTTSKKVDDYLKVINATQLAGWSIISTSFPSVRPASGQGQIETLIDFYAQSLLHTTNTVSTRAYGDYASSALGSATEYIPGMVIIPFASYLKDFEWWLNREGADKEYTKYIDLAKKIIQMPQFQGATFCWANENYDRIANIKNVADKGYGHNGTWNGYRLNQHITEINRCMGVYSFPLDFQFLSEDDDDDI